jgi:hypothetical protein
LGGGLVLNLQKEDETPNHKGEQQHVESEGRLFHQLIPSLEKRPLDAVEIQLADEMLHCLFSH